MEIKLTEYKYSLKRGVYVAKKCLVDILAVTGTGTASMRIVTTFAANGW